MALAREWEVRLEDGLVYSQHWSMTAAAHVVGRLGRLPTARVAQVVFTGERVCDHCGGIPAEIGWDDFTLCEDRTEVPDRG